MNQTFGKRLKTLRKERNLTQEQVAKVLSVQRTTYGEYERGNVMPPYEKIAKLAHYFDVSVGYLMGETNFQNDEDKLRAERLASHDIVDVNKMLNLLLEELQDEKSEIKVDGHSLDEESRELLKSSIESSLKMGKMIANMKRKDEEQ